jgi:hypothetical protein
MDTTITTEPAGKRARNSSVILTDRMCGKRVAKRVKFYDRKCPGLYVSITTAGAATFSFKFTDPATGKQRTGWLGVYNPETFAVEDARSRVYGLRGMGNRFAPVLAQSAGLKPDGVTAGSMRGDVLVVAGTVRQRSDEGDAVETHKGDQQAQ